MTPPPRQFYSPPPGYYRPFVYPTPITHATATAAPYGASPTKQPQQHRGRGKYEGTQMMLADSTTGSSLTMKKSPFQVSGLQCDSGEECDHPWCDGVITC